MPDSSTKMERKRRLLLLTGLPGSGKTTVVCKTAQALESTYRLAGFYTREIRETGQRKGFSLKSFDGLEMTFAHVELPKTHRLGKYGLDLSTLDEMVRHALRENSGVELFLIDEIGKMECQSERFVTAIRRLLEGERPVVATVAQKGSGFINEVKQQADEIWEVTRQNREIMAEHVVRWTKSLPEL
jgi:nucleoside-triphosphatase